MGTQHQKSGILPPAQLTQAFLGAQFFFEYIFHNPETNEADINHYLDMTPDEVDALNTRMHDEAAPHEDSVERHIHISNYWALIGQYFAELASKDGLTGLFNKRAFNGEIQSALERVKKYASLPQEERRKSPSAIGNVALIDIDLNRFKPINDVLSHASGDIVIQGAAQILRDQTRAQDYAGRLGGDEFSMLIVDVDNDQAQAILDRVQEAFKELILELPLNAPIHITDKNLEMLGRTPQDKWVASDLNVEEYRQLGLEVEKTENAVRVIVGASFGMALAEPDMTAKQLQAKSDNNMYQSKNESQRGWSYTR